MFLVDWFSNKRTGEKSLTLKTLIFYLAALSLLLTIRNVSLKVGLGYLIYIFFSNIEATCIHIHVFILISKRTLWYIIKLSVSNHIRPTSSVFFKQKLHIYFSCQHFRHYFSVSNHIRPTSSVSFKQKLVCFVRHILQVSDRLRESYIYREVDKCI